MRRWLIVIPALLLVAVIALFCVGLFALPSALALHDRIEVNRPRAAIYAMLENVRTYPEWSPWVHPGKKGSVQVEGEVGPGQRVSWEAGGRMSSQTIVRADPNERIDTVFEFAGGGAANLDFRVERSGSGAVVSARYGNSCTTNPLYVICRYLNYFGEKQAAQKLNAALRALRDSAAVLPMIDFEGLDAEIIEAEPRKYAFVENDVARDSGDDAVSAADRDRAFQLRVARAGQESLGVVADALRGSGARFSGAPATYTVLQDQAHMVFRIGYAFTGPAPAADPRVQIGETPEGKVLKITHHGARGDLPATYAKLRAYLDAYRLKPRTGPWELFRETTGATPLLEIYVPVH